MDRQIKSLRGLATAIAKDRQLRGDYAVKTGKGYETNRAFRTVETYLYLKTLTTSGKIQANHGESATAFIERIAPICRVSPNTLLTRLAWAQDLKLLKFNLFDITLSSFTNVCSIYFIKKEFTIYEENEKSPKLEYILKTKVLSENKQRQRYIFSSKLKRNPALNSKLKEAFLQAKNTEELRVCFENALEATFLQGSKIGEIAKQINPTLSIGNKSLKNMFGFKSTLSSTYIKRCLVKKQLIEVHTQAPVKGNAQKAKRLGTCNGFYFFSRKANCLTWFRPTEIEIKCA